MRERLKNDLEKLLAKYYNEYNALDEAKRLYESNSKSDILGKLKTAKTASEKIAIYNEYEEQGKREEKWIGKTPNQLLRNLDKHIELQFLIADLQAILKYQ